MNITDSMLPYFDVEIQNIILANKQIQMYANPYSGQYQWRDSRFYETSSDFDNEKADTRKDLANIVTEHILNYKTN